jgi:hypothetical protein
MNRAVLGPVFIAGRATCNVLQPSPGSDIWNVMPDTSEYIARLLEYTRGEDPVEMQKQTVSLISNLVEGVGDETLRGRPAADRWSVAEILAHLADAEIPVSWRYRQMIEQDGCVLAAYDQDLWARLGDYGSRSPHDSLQQFRLLREANVAMLERLSPEEWQRGGVHAERGAISIQEFVRHVAGHDRNHVEQIRKVLGK